MINAIKEIFRLENIYETHSLNMSFFPLFKQNLIFCLIFKMKFYSFMVNKLHRMAAVKKENKFRNRKFKNENAILLFLNILKIYNILFLSVF